MLKKTVKKIVGFLMLLLGIVFLFVPVIPSSPFFILGAITLGFITGDYIKKKLSLRKDGLIKNRNDREKEL